MCEGGVWKNPWRGQCPVPGANRGKGAQGWGLTCTLHSDLPRSEYKFTGGRGNAGRLIPDRMAFQRTPRFATNVRRGRGQVGSSPELQVSNDSDHRGCSVPHLEPVRHSNQALLRYTPSAILDGMTRLALSPTRASTLCRCLRPRQARIGTACAAEADPFNQLFQKKKPTGLRPSYWLNSQDSIQSQLKARVALCCAVQSHAAVLRGTSRMLAPRRTTLRWSPSPHLSGSGRKQPALPRPWHRGGLPVCRF